MLYLTPPKDFNPKFEVAGCHVEYQGRFLLLHRNDHGDLKVDLWGVPAGKIEPKETPVEAVRRETREETGLDIPLSEIQYLMEMYVKYPKFDFVYHLCRAKLLQNQELVLNRKIAHDFKWATPEEALKMRLIEDEGACIKIIQAKEAREYKLRKR